MEIKIGSSNKKHVCSEIEGSDCGQGGGSGEGGTGESEQGVSCGPQAAGVGGCSP